MKKLAVFLLALFFMWAPSICLAIPISYHATHHNGNSHAFSFRGNNGGFISDFGGGLAVSAAPLHLNNFGGSNPEMDLRQAPPPPVQSPFINAAGNPGPLQNSFQSEIAAISEPAGNNIAPVPEPATLILLGSGLLGLIGFRRLKK
jgi:hypothetical protein